MQGIYTPVIFIILEVLISEKHIVFFSKSYQQIERAMPWRTQALTAALFKRYRYIYYLADSIYRTVRGTDSLFASNQINITKNRLKDL